MASVGALRPYGLRRRLTWALNLKKNHAMEARLELRSYEALISQPGPLAAAFRVTVVARSLDDAKERLESEYGRGRVYSLWNEDDANKPRSAN